MLYFNVGPPDKEKFCKYYKLAINSDNKTAKTEKAEKQQKEEQERQQKEEQEERKQKELLNNNQHDTQDVNDYFDKSKVKENNITNDTDEMKPVNQNKIHINLVKEVKV